MKKTKRIKIEKKVVLDVDKGNKAHYPFDKLKKVDDTFLVRNAVDSFRGTCTGYMRRYNEKHEDKIKLVVRVERDDKTGKRIGLRCCRVKLD